MRLKSTSPQKIILLAALLLFCSTAFAQNFDRLTFRIDSFANVGLPKSALAEVKKLDLLARKQNNAPMQVRAVIYRMTFQSYLEEKALMGIIDSLRADIGRAAYPVKPVLQSVLAQMYYGYYEQNRYNYSRRTQTTRPGNDFRQWDLRTIVNESSRLYQLSLADAAKEQATPIEVMNGVLKGNKALRYLRPTLYDMLVQRALDFFLADEPALITPRQPFTLNNPAFFGGADAFVRLDIKTTDTASTWYRGLKYLQQASAFHLQKGNSEALADLDLQRFKFLYDKAHVEDKDALLVKALTQLAEKMATKPIAGDALFALGEHYSAKDSLKTARKYFEQARASYPTSLGGRNAAAMIYGIDTKSISASIENVNAPGKTLLARLEYRNVKQVKVAVYHLTDAQINQLRAKDKLEDYSEFDYSKNVAKLLQTLKPLQTNLLSPPDVGDYAKHSAEFAVNPLPVGKYFLLISNPTAKEPALTTLTTFVVSNLAYMARVLPNGTTELQVLERDKGLSVSGASVTVSVTDYESGKRKKNVLARGISNAAGKFIFQKKNSEFGVELAKGGDKFTDDSRYLNYYTPSPVNNDVATEYTWFFTDRQIYRPGQTIYFKGIHVQTIKGKSSIVPKKEISVKIRTALNQELTTIKLTTNEFGSIAGSFTLPQQINNGTVIIGAEGGFGQGGISVRVEEYKRPTFEVAFEPVTATYRVNDSVHVKGKVTAFSGFGLSGAKVAYAVKRYRSYRPFTDQVLIKDDMPFGVSADVASDTINTNASGEFKIVFKASAEGYKPLDMFNYDITADVTDGSGETRSATTTVKVGNNVLLVDAVLPPNLFKEDKTIIPVKLTNLNDQPQNGKLDVKIYALNEPAQAFKDRKWELPDQVMMPADEFKKLFPAYALKGEDDRARWTIKQSVKEITINVTDSTTSKLDLADLRQQPTGVYKIVIAAQNAQGDTTSQTYYIRQHLNPGKITELTDWVKPVGNTSVRKAGQTVNFWLGVSNSSHVLLEKYDGARLLSTEWLTVDGDTQQNISVTVPATVNNSFAVQFLMVNDNRAYNYYTKVRVSDTTTALDVRFLTFRNKLQPGEKEQWKLQITAPGNEAAQAELLAGLYDASLDAVAHAESWKRNMARSEPYQPNYFEWQTDHDFVSVASTRDESDRWGGPQVATHEYETLNMFDYNAYDDGSYAYQTYLEHIQSRKADEANDKKIAANYLKNAALVKKGYIVSGQVVTLSKHGTYSGLTGIKISIKNTSITTVSNSLGYYKIKVPHNATLVFKGGIYLAAREIKTPVNGYVVMEWRVPTEKELMSADPGVKSQKGDPTAEIRIDEPVGNSDVKMVVEDDKMFGYSAPAVSKVKFPKPVVALDREQLKTDTVTFAAGMLKKIPGLQVVDDYGDQAGMGGSKPIALRKNFAETAFFYPQLHTNAKGEVLIDFTIPEALTKWRFRGFAHTKALDMGYIEQEIVTQKQLSISANTPRFLREGDTLTVSARLANLSTVQQKGKIELQLFNALTMQPISLLQNAADAKQNFDIASATTKAVSFKMIIPAGLDAITYRLTADAGQFSDGEENTLPVLPNRMLVTESMPMMLRAGQQKTFTFDKLVNQSSNTLKNKTLTLEYTQNPAWYAVQALPYMMEFPYECSEQIFSRYYANSLGTSLVNKMPVIKAVFDRWKASDSKALLSNLEKNQELKGVLLEETPWLRDAANEAEQKQRIALLFDLNKMNYELTQNQDKLVQKQLPGGGFPWFAGQEADRYITQHVLAGIGQLYSLGIADVKDTKLKTIADKAVSYLDGLLLEEDRDSKKEKTAKPQPLSAIDIHAYYAKSYFEKPLGDNSKTLLAAYLKQAAVQWTTRSAYEQGMIALTMQRNGRAEVTKTIIKSLKETAQQSAEQGMYWANNRAGWYWYESPIETQSLMIELFTLVPGNDKEVEEMKIWLLRNKQANNWKTTKATAAAVYALVLKGQDLLADKGTATIKLNNTNLQSLKPDTKAEAGTGYLKTTWVDEQVKPELGKVEISNNTQNINWGALHWQYLENLDKITASSTDIQLERKYFIQQQGNAGVVLVPVDATHIPKVGDVLKVVVYMKAGRDMEYIHLKDMRPAGTEPVDVLSTYKYQDGLYYYQVTKDVATNFFISQMKKGNYVFEYSLRVAQPGNFSTGISTVQSMYAPEFNAHSEGRRLKVR